MVHKVFNISDYCVNQVLKMSVSFSDHSAFETLSIYSNPHSKFFDNFEISWNDVKDQMSRNNSAHAMVVTMIHNLNCKIVNKIPQNKKSRNMYTMFITTKEYVSLKDQSVCDRFCLCYGSYVKWLYVYFPCNIVDCVVRKNDFMEQCDKSHIVSLKAVQLLETIDLY